MLFGHEFASSSSNQNGCEHSNWFIDFIREDLNVDCKELMSKREVKIVFFRNVSALQFIADDPWVLQLFYCVIIH